MRSLWNLLSNKINGAWGIYAIPTQLGLCLTDKCNLKCPYCMREQFLPPEGTITLGDVKKLIKKMPYVTGVCIMGLCEPLINPNLTEIIRWLKNERKIKISLSTNGTIPLNEEKLSSLRFIDDMSWSIDTSDKPTFAYLRGGANLEYVMGNFEKTIQYKRERGLSKHDNPPIHINAVITSLNFHQIPDLIKMFEPYAEDLNYLMIDPITRPDFQDFEIPFILQKEKFSKSFVEYIRIAKESPVQVIGFDWLFKRSYYWNRCHLAYNGMFIEPNGDIYFCYKYDYVLGNAFKGNPLKTWNSPKAQNFRRRLQTKRPPLRQCHFCNFARTNWQIGGSYYKKMEDIE